jgi:hypothetical protein
MAMSPERGGRTIPLRPDHRPVNWRSHDTLHDMSIATVTLFRLAAIAWLAGSAARLLMFATDAFGYADLRGSSLAGTLIGVALGLAVGAALWAMPGRFAAVVGVVFGFYAVPGLLAAQVLGTPPWFVVLVPLGLAAFLLSAACLWRTRSGTTA